MGTFRVEPDAAASERLRAHLGRLSSASQTDLVTPLIRDQAKEVGPSLARKNFGDTIWSDLKLDQLPMWLRELEAQQRDKHGSYSDSPGYYGPGGLSEGCHAFYQAEPSGAVPSYDARGNQGGCGAASRHANRILRGVLSIKKGLSLSPISLDAAAADFVGSSNLGWPYFSSDPRFVPMALDLSRHILGDLSLDSSHLFPAVLNTRGTPRGLFQRAKGRVVFGCSRVIGNLEKMVFRPVFNQVCGPVGFAAWEGQRSVDAAITYMLNEANKKQRTLISMDFANFDASVPFSVIDRQFDALESMFTPSSLELLRYLREHFKACRIITPSYRELTMERKRGIPSGSVLTNLIGSMANLWMVAYSASILGTRIYESQVQGDDGVYLFEGEVNPDDLAAVLAEHFGVVMHADKSLHAHREVHFLQNVHRHSYRDEFNIAVGVRPIMRVVNGMMSYERFRPNWNGYLDTLRWFQQMESASSHPCFRDFVRTIAAEDIFALKPIDTLISKAGGESFVNSVLGGGPWSNKISVGAIRKSRVAREIQRLSEEILSHEG